MSFSRCNVKIGPVTAAPVIKALLPWCRRCSSGRRFVLPVRLGLAEWYCSVGGPDRHPQVGRQPLLSASEMRVYTTVSSPRSAYCTVAGPFFPAQDAPYAMVGCHSSPVAVPTSPAGFFTNES